MSDHQLPILGTVTPGRERYCAILADHIDRMWPGHGPVYYALPAGRTASYAGVIQTDAAKWTGTLLAGLRHLRAARADHVFMLLEDHVPLQPCDVTRIDRVLAIMRTHDLKCVFFTKYDWPWSHTSEQQDEEGRVIGWRTIDIVTIDGHRLARMPKDFFRYNQAQPAIWSLDYYIEIVEEAIRRGIYDPWRFESYIKPDQAQHYVSEYKWPSWSNGYLERGLIDWRAIRLMKMPEAKPLRDQLLREHFKGVPLTPRLLYALGEFQQYWQLAYHLPGRVLRRAGRLLRVGA